MSEQVMHCCFAGCYLATCESCKKVHCIRAGCLEDSTILYTPITGQPLSDLRELVVTMDAWLDDSAEHPASFYRDNPLAQHWARVAKAGEESGEAIDALIGWTGQNPRKGICANRDDLLHELADVALTGLYAIQHFTKNIEETMRIVLDRAQYQYDRVHDAEKD